MAQEMILRAAIVSAELTRAASIIILNKYGGFYASEGAGGYVFADGRQEIVPCMAWHISTAAQDSARFEFVSRFALDYCKMGNQESVYFRDVDGIAYLVQASGQIDPIE